MYVTRSSSPHDPQPRPSALARSFAPPPTRSVAGLGRLAALALAVALTFGAAACREQRPGPEEVLRAFLGDVGAGRGDAAWAALTEASKKALEERHEALAKAAGKPSDPKPSRILFEELELVRLNQPETIAVVSPLGYDVTLRVTVKDGKSADMHLVREGASWKVDLLGSLQAAPPLDQALQGAKKEEPPRPADTETSTAP